MTTVNTMASTSVKMTFKPVPGGWVFQSPGRRFFSKGPRYFVNDTQKSEILAILTPRRPGLWQAVYWTVAMLWAGAIAGSVWMFSSGTIPSAIGCLAAGAFFLISLVATLFVLMRLQLRQLRPVLAGLPTTDEEITPSDIRETALNSVSFKNLVLTCVCFAAGCIVQISGVLFVVTFNYLSHHTLSVGAGTYLCAVLACVFGLGAFNSYRHVVLKEKQITRFHHPAEIRTGPH